jgi:hypothetical protein
MTPRPHDADVITSAANPRVRAALALRERRGRDETGRLLVDGTREVLRALEAGLVVREAFVVDGARSQEAAAILERLATLGTPPVAVAGSAWSRLAYGERGSEIVAIVDAPPADLARLDPILAARADPLLIVVEDAEKPGNLGAIARSADGAGATALLWLFTKGRPRIPGTRTPCERAWAPCSACRSRLPRRGRFGPGCASARSGWLRPGCRLPRTTARWICAAPSPSSSAARRLA